MTESSTTTPEQNVSEDARTSVAATQAYPAPPTHKAMIVRESLLEDADDPAEPVVAHTEDVRDDDETSSDDAGAASSPWDPIPQPSNPVNPFGQYQKKKALPNVRGPAKGSETSDTKRTATATGNNAD